MRFLTQNLMKHYFVKRLFFVNRIIHACEIMLFLWSKMTFFFIFASNIDSGCSLETPLWDDSNRFHQSIFWAMVRKIMCTLINKPKKNYPWKKRTHYGSVSGSLGFTETLHKQQRSLQHCTSLLTYPTFLSIYIQDKIFRRKRVSTGANCVHAYIEI